MWGVSGVVVVRWDGGVPVAGVPRVLPAGCEFVRKVRVRRTLPPGVSWRDSLRLGIGFMVLTGSASGLQQGRGPVTEGAGIEPA